MPTFQTPEPISVTVEIGVGDIRIAAGERTETTVDVRPSDPARKGDVTAAEQTQVEFAGGRLVVKGPKGWRRSSFRAPGDSIAVQIELPAGSHVRAQAGAGTLRCTGPLGECRYKGGVGDVHVEQAGPAVIKSGAGDITMDRALGHAEVTMGSGTLQIGLVDGSAVVKNSNGDTWIGEVTGDLRVNAANGKISIDHAHAAVAAKTANGDVRLGEVVHGEVLAQTGFGKLEVGVRDGVAAWLDLNTGFGDVHNDLDDAGQPEPGEDTVEVRARSGMGDITIRRCVTSGSTPRA